MFGFNGWSTSIIDMTIDYMDDAGGGRWNIGLSASVRITLKDGAFHEVDLNIYIYIIYIYDYYLRTLVMECVIMHVTKVKHWKRSRRKQ